MPIRRRAGSTQANGRDNQVNKQCDQVAHRRRFVVIASHMMCIAKDCVVNFG